MMRTPRVVTNVLPAIPQVADSTTVSPAVSYSAILAAPGVLDSLRLKIPI
jgi:hypothetical protein